MPGGCLGFLPPTVVIVNHVGIQFPVHYCVNLEHFDLSNSHVLL